MDRGYSSEIFGSIFALLVIGGLGGALAVINLQSHQQITMTVANDYVKSGRSSEKRVVTADSQTYNVEDMIVRGHFNSGDVYARLLNTENQVICADVYGHRVPFLSLYQNIKDFRSGPCS